MRKCTKNTITLPPPLPCFPLPLILQVNLRQACPDDNDNNNSNLCLSGPRQTTLNTKDELIISAASDKGETKKKKNSLHVWAATLFSNTPAAQSMESVSRGGGSFRESWGSRWKSKGCVEWRSQCSDGNLYICWRDRKSKKLWREKILHLMLMLHDNPALTAQLLVLQQSNQCIVIIIIGIIKIKRKNNYFFTQQASLFNKSLIEK